MFQFHGPTVTASRTCSPGVAGRPAVVEALEGRRLLSTVTFTLVPSQSTATLSAAGALTVTPQSKGSLTDCYKGSIVADVRPGSIQLLPKTSIVAMANKPKAKPGNSPADFAAVAAGLVNVALRNLVFGLTSTKQSVTTGGKFSVAGETFRVNAGKVDYAGMPGVPISGSKSLVGLTAANKSTQSARYV